MRPVLIAILAFADRSTATTLARWADKPTPTEACIEAGGDPVECVSASR